MALHSGSSGVEHTGRGGFLLLPGDLVPAQHQNSRGADARLHVGAIPPLVSLAAGFAGWRYRQQRVVFLQQHLDIDWLNKLSWQDFERQVGEVYRQRGYQVDEFGGGGADGGVDLRLRRDGTTAIVQCKRWKTYKVGVKPVRELFGVM